MCVIRTGAPGGGGEHDLGDVLAYFLMNVAKKFTLHVQTLIIALTDTDRFLSLALRRRDDWCTITVVKVLHVIINVILTSKRLSAAAEGTFVDISR